MVHTAFQPPSSELQPLDHSTLLHRDLEAVSMSPTDAGSKPAKIMQLAVRAIENAFVIVLDLR